MIRKYKKTLFFSSLFTLLPVAVGLLLWDKLPERFATHWGIDGQPDGWSSLPFAVFFPPLLMLAVQWLCVWVTAKDPGNKDRNVKPQKLVLWIIPLLSNLVCGTMYALALGMEFDMEQFMMVFMGLLFVFIGNYLPKCKMNSTIGIKVPWAYTSEENWNATHRFGGRVWVVGGFVIALCAFLPGDFGVYLMLAAILVLAFIPMVYSWQFYRKQKARGDALIPLPKLATKGSKASLIFVALILIGVAVILFSGTIEVRFGEDAFTVEATYHDNLTVEYAAIDSIEYREGNVDGLRTFGFGSLRLLLGTFENKEFGTYTRYTYTNPEGCIVLTAGDRILVLSGKDAAETQAIYENLLVLTEAE